VREKRGDWYGKIRMIVGAARHRKRQKERGLEKKQFRTENKKRRARQLGKKRGGEKKTEPGKSANTGEIGSLGLLAPNVCNANWTT